MSGIILNRDLPVWMCLQTPASSQWLTIIIACPARVQHKSGSSGSCVGRTGKSVDVLVSSGVAQLHQGEQHLSTSLLYHAWVVRGSRSRREKKGTGVINWLTFCANQGVSKQCPPCGAFALTAMALRLSRTGPDGLEPSTS